MEAAGRRTLVHEVNHCIACLQYILQDDAQSETPQTGHVKTFFLILIFNFLCKLTHTNKCCGDVKLRMFCK